MSGARHTPGPWVVRNRADVMTENGGRRADGEETADNDAWHICHYQNDTPTLVKDGTRREGLPLDESDANLALIAAAPELYEALNAIVERYAWREDEMAGARAALAKARGEP